MIRSLEVGQGGDTRRSMHRRQPVSTGLRSQGVDHLACPRTDLTKVITTIFGLNGSPKKNEIQMGRRNDHSQRFIVVAEEFVADFHQQLATLAGGPVQRFLHRWDGVAGAWRPRVITRRIASWVELDAAAAPEGGRDAGRNRDVPVRPSPDLFWRHRHGHRLCPVGPRLADPF